MDKNACTRSTRWHVTDRVADEALRFVDQAAAQALAERGAFHLVLAGGTTPRALYERMPSLQTDWSRWHIWFGDERCLPAADEARNSRMAYAAWLQNSAIPSAQIHVMKAELGPDAGAADYAAQLRNAGTFDLVLLGLGEDGHTASLFPGQGNEYAVADVVAVSNAPKSPAERISLSASRLSDARHVLFMVAGEGKRDAVAAWRQGELIPAAVVCPVTGVDVLVEPVCMEETL